MQEIEVAQLSGVEEELIRSAVRDWARESGLTVALDCTLRAYPGCVHWHFRRARRSGTLELTWWPKTGRLWFKIQDGRKPSWVGPELAQLQRSLVSILTERPDPLS